MQISGVSLALTSPFRLCLLRVLLCRSHCYKLSPFKHTGGGDTAPAFSGRHVCLQLTWEVGLPLSPVEFSSFHHSHKLSRSWMLGACPYSRWSLSCPPSLFIYSPRKDSLPPIFGAQCAPPSFPRVFIVFIAYYSVSLFFLGGGWSVQGAMLLWPMVVCGSTTYREAHLVCIFPSRLGAGDSCPMFFEVYIGCSRRGLPWCFTHTDVVL
jgi:hypothetical protein